LLPYQPVLVHRIRERQRGQSILRVVQIIPIRRDIIRVIIQSLRVVIRVVHPGAATVGRSEITVVTIIRVQVTRVAVTRVIRVHRQIYRAGALAVRGETLVPGRGHIRERRDANLAPLTMGVQVTLVRVVLKT